MNIEAACVVHMHILKSSIHWMQTLTNNLGVQGVVGTLQTSVTVITQVKYFVLPSVSWRQEWKTITVFPTGFWVYCPGNIPCSWQLKREESILPDVLLVLLLFIPPANLEACLFGLLNITAYSLKYHTAELEELHTQPLRFLPLFSCYLTRSLFIECRHLQDTIWQ